jgi:hypothetical protein
MRSSSICPPRGGIGLVEPLDLRQRVEQELRLDARLHRPQPRLERELRAKDPVELRVMQDARGPARRATIGVEEHGRAAEQEPVRQLEDRVVEQRGRPVQPRPRRVQPGERVGCGTPS